MPTTTTESGWFNPVFKAIKPLLVGKLGAAIKGGLHLADVPELSAGETDPDRGKRPYGVVIPEAVRDHKFTNMSKYADLEMTLQLVADTFDVLDDELCPRATEALQDALTGRELSSGVLKITMIRPGDIVYEKIEQIWEARLSFMVKATQPRRPSTS